MFRIFRGLRSDLMAGRSFRKYLFYALGEILLVVIGILIALQVNNWNEDRRDRAIALKNLEALKVDLARDTALIHRSLQHARRDSALLGNIRRKLSREDITLDTLVFLARYRFDPWIFINVAFHNNTYTGLLSTGELKKFPNSLQKQLMELNSLQEYYKLHSQADVGIYLDNTIAYGRRYPIRDVGHIDPDSYLADRIWEEATLTDLGRELNGLIGVKYSNYYGHIPGLEDILDKTEKLLQDLTNPMP